MLRRILARFRKDRRGAAAIEFGVLVPLLALMAVSVVDLGLAIYRKMQVESAAQAGVEYAIAHGFDANAISAAVVNATNATTITATPAPTKYCGCASSSGVISATCGATCPGGRLAGTYTTVSAQANYWTIINYQVVPASYAFSMQSKVRLQ
ncbi:TadE/TadG family type IV pilus assembly protein [Bradyrhizobium semiaridum]|uniref:TadE/TadG family type IV pilus assembly protein n=1 Tax=Bradyrhizobium semiaridum TaxID=2821404 RepID=UPI001CE2B403|nr:TadE/TadG family type IV pilus assembly protein [Bradyrhizobium semiaridum]